MAIKGNASYEKAGQRTPKSIGDMQKEITELKGTIAGMQQTISGIIGSVGSINSNVFQPRGDLEVDASTLTWNQSGVYRVNSNHPVNGINNGFLIHFSPYKGNGVWIQLLTSYSAQSFYMRGNWYGTVRSWVQIK